MTYTGHIIKSRKIKCGSCDGGKKEIVHKFTGQNTSKKKPLTVRRNGRRKCRQIFVKYIVVM